MKVICAMLLYVIFAVLTMPAHAWQDIYLSPNQTTHHLAIDTDHTINLYGATIQTPEHWTKMIIRGPWRYTSNTAAFNAYGGRLIANDVVIDINTFNDYGLTIDAKHIEINEE